MNTPESVKIGTRVTPAQKDILEDIAAEGGFKSSYALLKYIIYILIRARNAKLGCDDVDAPLPLDVIELFIGSARIDAALIQEAMKKVDKRKIWREAKRLQRHPKEKKTIEQEVRDLFADCEADGYQMQWKPDIKKGL